MYTHAYKKILKKIILPGEGKKSRFYAKNHRKRKHGKQSEWGKNIKKYCPCKKGAEQKKVYLQCRKWMQSQILQEKKQSY